GVHPFDPLAILLDPAAWTIALAGIVGFYVQTVALQVGHVNGVTAVLVVGETAAPGIIGVLFLHDDATPGMAIVALIGFIGAVVGAVLVALYSSTEADHLGELEPPKGGWSLKGRFTKRRRLAEIAQVITGDIPILRWFEPQATDDRVPPHSAVRHQDAAEAASGAHGTSGDASGSRGTSDADDGAAGSTGSPSGDAPATGTPGEGDGGSGDAPGEDSPGGHRGGRDPLTSRHRFRP